MIIYDSTNPYDIPTTAEAVAGYVDGIYAWDINGWARFPSQPKIGISVNPFNQIGDALDVETGDATPAQAPAWVKARLAQGAKQPWVYVNRSNQQATEDALWAAGITTAEVAMWVATLDGATSVPQYRYPIAAVQYADSTLAGGHFDLSILSAPQLFGAAAEQPQHPVIEEVFSYMSTHGAMEFGRGKLDSNGNRSLYVRRWDSTAHKWAGWANVGGNLGVDDLNVEAIRFAEAEDGTLAVSVVGVDGFEYDTYSSDGGVSWSAFDGPRGVVDGLIAVSATVAPASPAPVAPKSVSGNFTGTIS